jgi:hypothetical protein
MLVRANTKSWRSPDRLTCRLSLSCTVFLVLLFACTTQVCAGVELWPQSYTTPLGSMLPTSSRTSLLDPSRLEISHQLVFAYSSGGVVRDNTGGLWRTNFRYEFSNPLTLDLSVGSSLSYSGRDGFQSQKPFLESLSLRYRPNDNFYFHLMYREAPRTLFWSPYGCPY